MKKNIIISARFGSNNSIIDITKKYMVKYSMKCNADFEFITDDNYVIPDFVKNGNFIVSRDNNFSYLFKILLVNQYLEKYDKVLWLDDTVFIKDNCENLFEMITNDDYVLAYNEGENDDYNSWKHDYNFIYNHTKFIINRTNYINSGVIVYTKKILDVMTNDNIIKYKKLLLSSYPHQCILNFLLQKYDVKILKLKKTYNTMMLDCNYDSGRNIKPENISKKFILSEDNKIFHVTGYYKNRQSIIKHIDDTLNNKSIPIYISLTSIFNRQNILSNCLKSIIAQSKLPDKIFLYLSEDSYLLDQGFNNKVITDEHLLNFLNDNNKLIDIRWVKNEGSYRKLLPLLEEKWNEDCIIITIDDDVIYNNKLIENMVNDYNIHKCVINYRGFNPTLKDNLYDFSYTERNREINYRLRPNEVVGDTHLYNFPTGIAGILYKPQFFHKTGKLIFNESIYMNKCTTGDDIWFYLLRIKNGIECFLGNKKFCIREQSAKNGLFNTYNIKSNTISLLNTLEMIDDYLLNNS